MVMRRAIGKAWVPVLLRTAIASIASAEAGKSPGARVSRATHEKIRALVRSVQWQRNLRPLARSGERRFRQSTQWTSALLLGCVLADGCGSRSDSTSPGLPPPPGPLVDRPGGGGRVVPPEVSVAAPPGAGGRPPGPSAPPPFRDASIPPPDAPSSLPDASIDGAATNPDARADAAGTYVDATRDAPSDVRAEDVLTSPDCNCPPSNFQLDVTLGTTAYMLTAPNPLGIYCIETSVQLGHPPCTNVYRLSACYGANFAPPCIYIAVDGPRLLLGTFLDETGAVFDIIEGDIEPDPPSGRVATGSFAATIRPRAGGDTATLSGVYRACATRFPSCDDNARSR